MGFETILFSSSDGNSQTKKNKAAPGTKDMANRPVRQELCEETFRFTNANKLEFVKMMNSRRH